MTRFTKNASGIRYTVVAAAVATAVFTTSIQAAGSTTVDVSGYIKFDTMLTDYADGNPPAAAIDDFYIPSLVPTAAPSASGQGESAKFNAHAKQSRFRIKTKTALKNGKKLGGLIEMDSGPGSATSNGEVTTNRSGVDLRHAVISYDKWMFGQTWSNMLNGSSIAETLDFFALAEGMIDTRQPQIRYTNGAISVSLENPETRINTSTGRVDTNDSTMPDVVVKYTHKAGFGNVSVAVIARQLSFERSFVAATPENPAKFTLATQEISAVDSTTTATGISIAGRIKAGGKDDVRFAVTAGKGLGRYLGLALNSDGYLNANNEIETIDQTAANIGYRHFWNDNTRSTFGYATYSISSDAAAGTINDKSSSIHVNLLHSPSKELTLGVELINATLEKTNGNEGDFTRLQFSAKYGF